jgi:hypothetical protein
MIQFGFIWSFFVIFLTHVHILVTKSWNLILSLIKIYSLIAISYSTKIFWHYNDRYNAFDNTSKWRRQLRNTYNILIPTPVYVHVYKLLFSECLSKVKVTKGFLFKAWSRKSKLLFLLLLRTIHIVQFVSRCCHTTDFWNNDQITIIKFTESWTAQYFQFTIEPHSSLLFMK